MDVNYDLRRLTPGERLWVWRAGSIVPGGATQEAAARSLGVHPDTYQAAERDRVALPCPIDDKTLRTWLTLPIALRLCRRRYGHGSRVTAAVLGYGSHVALLKAEKKGDRALLAAWRRLGFKGFPNR